MAKMYIWFITSRNTSAEGAGVCSGLIVSWSDQFFESVNGDFGAFFDLFHPLELYGPFTALFPFVEVLFRFLPIYEYFQSFLNPFIILFDLFGSFHPPFSPFWPLLTYLRPLFVYLKPLFVHVWTTFLIFLRPISTFSTRLTPLARNLTTACLSYFLSPFGPFLPIFSQFHLFCHMLDPYCPF